MLTMLELKFKKLTTTTTKNNKLRRKQKKLRLGIYNNQNGVQFNILQNNFIVT